MTNKVGVAVIGTGNIADGYVSDLLTYDNIQVLGVTDMDKAKRDAFADKHGVNTYANNEALFADPNVQVVVNLTPHFAHKAVTEQALLAGKHVYSEKPLSLTSEDAWGLVNLAKEKNLRLACSPFTVIGEAQQTAWKMIRDGKLGKVRVVYGEANWGRIESWHPAPKPFYEVGAMFDVGVYLLGIATTFFGAAKRVLSYGSIVSANRQTKDGEPFILTTPDWMVTLIELADSTQLRLTTNFYVSNNTTRQTGLEFHGDLGSLHVDSFFMANSAVSFGEFGQPLTPISIIKEPLTGIAWGRGVQEVVCAIQENRPHRFTGEQAAHITDILVASKTSLETGQMVEVNSAFAPIAPADWAI
jgi:predicted dehydrogenase